MAEPKPRLEVTMMTLKRSPAQIRSSKMNFRRLLDVLRDRRRRLARLDAIREWIISRGGTWIDRTPSK